MTPGRRTGGAPRWVRVSSICGAAALLLVLTILYLTAAHARAALAHLASKGTVDRPVRGIPYADLINHAARTHHLNPALLAAVVTAESNFNPHARSRRGAYGLMQVMPETWREFEKEPACAPEAARLTSPPCMDDPAANLNAGAAYLEALVLRFKGDPILALAAYNAGAGAVEQHAGIPPFPETTRYLHLVALAWLHLQEDGTLTPFWLNVIRSVYVWERVRAALIARLETGR